VSPHGSDKVGKLGVKGDGGVMAVVGWGMVRWAGWCCGWLRRWSVTGRIKYFRHLAMDRAVDVVAEGGMGILVLKRLGLGLLLAIAFLTALMSELRSGWSEGVIVNVPGGQRQVKLGRRGFRELVGGAGVVSGCQLGDGSCCALPRAPFMLLERRHLWYSFIKWGAWRFSSSSQVLSLLG
jgi:hypothetical protein